MADSALATLKQQLQSDDVKVRRKACQQLGKLGDPAAIPLLTRVYKDPAEDPAVKAAAADALKRYARQIPGGGASRSMQMMAGGLAILFVVLLILNLVLRMGGDEADTTAINEPAEPTPRQTLVDQYQTLLTQSRAAYDAMRLEWGDRIAENRTCEYVGQFAAVNPLPLREIDQYTYPDVETLAETVNNAAASLQEVISLYESACASGTRGTIEQTNTANTLLRNIGSTLDAADMQLDQVINNPQPTVPPPGWEPEVVELPSPTPAPTDLPITPRDQLIAQYRALLESARTNFANMRDAWLAEGVDLPVCSIITIPIQPVPLSELDQRTYQSDLTVAVNNLNQAVTLLQQVNQVYIGSPCPNPDYFTPDVITTAQDQVRQVEALLAQVDSQLIDAEFNPAATQPPPGYVEPTPEPTAVIGTPREDLIAQYQQLVQQVRADYDALQLEWARGAGGLTCEFVLAQPQQQPIDPDDQARYSPDFDFVSNLNIAIGRLTALTNTTLIACSSGERGTTEQVRSATTQLERIEAGLVEAETALQALTSPP